MKGIYMCNKFYNALFDNYKTVKQDGKKVVKEICTQRMYWDVNNTVHHSGLKAD